MSFQARSTRRMRRSRIGANTTPPRAGHHWIVNPPDGRLPQRSAQARPIPVQRCGSLQRGEPCDSYEDYGLGVRCIVHGGGFPDAMFPAVYNANMRIMQSPGLVAITYELIHDTRIIPLEPVTQPLSPTNQTYMGTAVAAGKAPRWSSKRATSRRTLAARRPGFVSSSDSRAPAGTPSITRSPSSIRRRGRRRGPPPSTSRRARRMGVCSSTRAMRGITA